MNKFIMLCGLPASGKTTFAQELKYTNGEDKTVILSSDTIREELFGERRQDKNGEVFDEMNRRTFENLEKGKNVIYDATNTNRKRRVALLKMLQAKFGYGCLYIVVGIINTPDRCRYTDSLREYKVGFDVIDKFAKTYEIPTYNEGWDQVILRSNIPYATLDEVPKISSLLDRYNLVDYDTFINTLRSTYRHPSIQHFNYCIDMPQDSKYHTLSVSRHIYEVYKYMYLNYFGEYREEALLASIFHDIGKPDCKRFDKKGENAKYASYIGHDYASAQIAFVEMWRMLPYINKQTMRIVVDLIQFHMCFRSETLTERAKLYLGEDMFKVLEMLHEADVQAR